MATASRYNLLENGDFRYATHWSSTAGRITNEDVGAPQLSENMYRINGDPQDDKAISHNVAVSGKKGDTYVLAGWAKADSVPIKDEDTRTFQMIAVFNNTDGTITEIPTKTKTGDGSLS